MRHQITGFSNPTIKRLRSLREKKHRKREGLFLAEGLRILTEALDSGKTPRILVVVEDTELHPLAQKIEAATAAAGGDVIETSEAIIAKLSGKSNPQSIIGIYQDHPVPLEELDRSESNIWLVAQALRDPRQPRHDIADRRCSWRRRPDPDRRLRRSLFGRGGARQHGRDLHPADRPDPLAGISRLAAQRARRTGRHQPEHRHGLSIGPLQATDLSADWQRSAGIAGRL